MSDLGSVNIDVGADTTRFLAGVERAVNRSVKSAERDLVAGFDRAFTAAGARASKLDRALDNVLKSLKKLTSAAGDLEFEVTAKINDAEFVEGARQAASRASTSIRDELAGSATGVNFEPMGDALDQALTEAARESAVEINRLLGNSINDETFSGIGDALDRALTEAAREGGQEIGRLLSRSLGDIDFTALGDSLDEALTEAARDAGQEIGRVLGNAFDGINFTELSDKIGESIERGVRTSGDDIARMLSRALGNINTGALRDAITQVNLVPFTREVQRALGRVDLDALRNRLGTLNTAPLERALAQAMRNINLGGFENAFRGLNFRELERAIERALGRVDVSSLNRVLRGLDLTGFIRAIERAFSRVDAAGLGRALDAALSTVNLRRMEASIAEAVRRAIERGLRRGFGGGGGGPGPGPGPGGGGGGGGGFRGSFLGNFAANILQEALQLGIEAGRMIFRGINRAIQESADIVEGINVVRIVFDEGAQSLIDFSETTADSLGLAQSEVLQFTGVLGASLLNFGLDVDQASEQAENLTRIGADLASAFNTDVADAVDAIGALLRGQTEPIRRYGININQADIVTRALAEGLAETSGQVGTSTRAIAGLSLLYDQAAIVAGDFAATQEQLPNLIRRVAAQGKDLLGVFGDPFREVLRGLLLDVVEVFPQIEAEVRELAEGIADSLEPAFEAIGDAIDRLPDLMDRVQPGLENIGGGLSETFAEALPILEELGVIIIDTLGGAFEALGSILAIIGPDLIDALKVIGFVIKGVLGAINLLLDGLQKVAEFMDRITGGPIRRYIAGVTGAAEASGAVVEEVDALAISMDDLESASNRAASAVSSIEAGQLTPVEDLEGLAAGYANLAAGTSGLPLEERHNEIRAIYMDAAALAELDLSNSFEGIDPTAPANLAAAVDAAAVSLNEFETAAVNASRTEIAAELRASIDALMADFDLAQNPILAFKALIGSLQNDVDSLVTLELAFDNVWSAAQREQLEAGGVDFIKLGFDEAIERASALGLLTEDVLNRVVENAAIAGADVATYLDFESMVRLEPLIEIQEVLDEIYEANVRSTSPFDELASSLSDLNRAGQTRVVERIARLTGLTIPEAADRGAAALRDLGDAGVSAMRRFVAEGRAVDIVAESFVTIDDAIAELNATALAAATPIGGITEAFREMDETAQGVVAQNLGRQFGIDFENGAEQALQALSEIPGGVDDAFNDAKTQAAIAGHDVGELFVDNANLGMAAAAQGLDVQPIFDLFEGQLEVTQFDVDPITGIASATTEVAADIRESTQDLIRSLGEQGLFGVLSEEFGEGGTQMEQTIEGLTTDINAIPASMRQMLDDLGVEVQSFGETFASNLNEEEIHRAIRQFNNMAEDGALSAEQLASIILPTDLGDTLRAEAERLGQDPVDLNVFQTLDVEGQLDIIRNLFDQADTLIEERVSGASTRLDEALASGAIDQSQLGRAAVAGIGVDTTGVTGGLTGLQSQIENALQGVTDAADDVSTEFADVVTAGLEQSSEAFTGLQEASGIAATAVEDSVEDINDAVADGLPDVEDAIDDLEVSFDGLSGTLTDELASLRDDISALVEDISSALGSIGGAANTAAGNFSRDFNSRLNNALSSAGGTAERFGPTMAGGLRDLGSVGTNAAGAFNRELNAGIADALTRAQEQVEVLDLTIELGFRISNRAAFINDLASAVKRAIAIGLRAATDSTLTVTPTRPTTRPDDGLPGGVQQFARGGIFDRATLGVMGEAGREVLLPVTDLRRSLQLLSQSGLLDQIAASFQTGTARLSRAANAPTSFGSAIGTSIDQMIATVNRRQGDFQRIGAAISGGVATGLNSNDAFGSDAFSSLVSQEVINSISEQMNRLRGYKFTANGKEIRPFTDLPRFASGAIHTRPGVGIFGEAGKEVTLPFKNSARFLDLATRSGAIDKLIDMGAVSPIIRDTFKSEHHTFTINQPDPVTVSGGPRQVITEEHFHEWHISEVQSPQITASRVIERLNARRRR